MEQRMQASTGRAIEKAEDLEIDERRIGSPDYLGEDSQKFFYQFLNHRLRKGSFQKIFER